MDAAIHVMSERGLCDTRISDIARRAGTSPALVIYYFGTKDRLLAEALGHSEERFHEETSRELATIPGARDRLVRLIELSCSSGTSPAGGWPEEWLLWLDLWARAVHDAEVARNRAALDCRRRTAIAAIVSDGQREGEFLPVDPDDFAVRLASLIDGLAIQVILGDPEVSSERMFRLCLSMAAADLGFSTPTRRPSRPRATNSPALSHR
jgi:AcrR family transcriptional regulator